MDPAAWMAIGGFGAAFLTALGAWLYSARVGARIDTLNTQLRDAALIAQAGKSEVEHLHQELQDASAALVEAQRAHRDEVGELRQELGRTQDALQAAATPSGVRASLTRRPVDAPLPTTPASTKTPAPGAKTPLPTAAKPPALNSGKESR